MSFEVTVTPQVYNVEVEVNPSVQPFDVQVITQQDLADLVDEAKQYAEDAEDSADSASASASSASASASASASSANSASASASSASGSANTATTQAGIATTQAGIATTQAGIATTKANEASQSASDALASEQASAQSASDALQSEQNALASEQASALSEANALASEQSASVSASTATTQAGIATTQAGIATTQAGNALTSANNALNSANAAAASAASAAQVGTSTLLTGFSTVSNTTIAGTDTILQAFQKAQGQINARVSGTGVAGRVSFWTGTGTQSGDSGLTWDNTNKRLGIGESPLATLGILGDVTLAGTNNINIIFKTTSTSFDQASLRYSITDQNLYIRNNSLGINKFIFRNSGELGVNLNTNPTQTLDVNGTGRIRNGVSLADTSGNVQIGTTTDAGFRLDVNGTARVQGNLTTNLTAGRVPFIGTGGVLSSSANLLWDDSISRLEVSALQGIIRITGGTSSAIGQKSASLEFFSTDVSVQSGSTGARVRAEIATVYDNAGGGASSLVFYTQNGTTDPVVERWRIGMAGILESLGSQTIRTSTGDLTIATNSGNGNIVLNPNGTGVISITDAKNISLGTTTGTRIGTATNQRLSLWNATPIVQPTTSVAGATRVGGGGTTLTDTDTFDGYTLAQIVRGLRNFGAFA
jgi:hypothetical protein